MANCVQCGRRFSSLGFGKGLCKWCRMHEAAKAGNEGEDARQTVMPAPWVRHDSAPFVAKAFFGINAAVFLGMALAGVSTTSPTSGQLIDWGANWGPLTLGGQWWRLLTSVFLHIGIFHFAMNMWCLWSLGSLAESLYGKWTFAAIYLVSGVAASLASKIWYFSGVSAGASGAIFGIAGAVIASYYLGEFSLPRDSIKGVLSSLVMFVGINLVLGGMGGATDNAAHVGGLVSGGILGALVARLAPDSDQWLRRIGVLLVVLLPVAAAAAWMQHSHAYRVHFDRANQLLEEKKPEQAVAEFQAALRLKPGFVPAHIGLARTYYFQGRLAEAEAELKRVAELNPAAAEPHMGLGLVAAAQKNCPAAIEHYKTGLAKAPELQGVNYDLGLCYVRLNRYDEAIAAYQKELEVGEDRDTELALAAAYNAKGMKPEAEQARRKAAQAPND